MGLFGRTRFLDPDVEDWCLETWAWLMANLGGMARLRQASLVLATREFFPPTEAQGHERALYVFERVKSLMGLEEWPARLEPFARPQVQRVGPLALIQTGGTANGTFRVENGEAVIGYASDLVGDPRHMIATFSHELAHYLLGSIRGAIPGGNELHELATELTVAHAGFGVFGANKAFHFEQQQDAFAQGWRSSRSGYFSERTWAFALALFTTLRGGEIPHGQLKPSIAELARKAERYLKRNEDLVASLRAID